MSENPSESSSEVKGIFKHIHHFGSATESVFRRIYSGLNRRSELERELKRQQLMMDMRIVQTENLRGDNAMLKKKLSDKASEIERLYSIMGSIDEGIIMQEVDGNVTMINEAAEKLLGGKKNFWESQLGTLFNDYIDVKETTSELMPLSESKQLALNDRLVSAQIVAIGDENGQRIGTIIILRDVTRDALAERIKDGFVTHISHELKTPMTVIKLASDVLNGAPEDAPVNRRILEKLVRNIDILDRLVLELLDISEMTAGTLELKQDAVMIESLIWDVANSMEDEIKPQKVELFVMTRDLNDLTVIGDAKRLQWALGHLIRNAAFYNTQGGWIAIAAGIDTIGDTDYVTIRVKDNGVGISTKDLPNIFERFYRGDARTQAGKKLDPRGLGQGLFVARTICDIHGGYLSVKSEIGKGSEFTMAIPLHKQPALPELQ